MLNVVNSLYIILTKPLVNLCKGPLIVFSTSLGLKLLEHIFRLFLTNGSLPPKKKKSD